MKRIALLVLSMVAIATGAQAGGFQIPEQGAKAAGLANAFAGVADDPSALWFNPAGVAFQDSSAVMVSADVIAPTHKFTDTGGTYETKDEVFFVPQAYVVYKNDDWPVILGLAINAPFGLSTDWSSSGAPFSAALSPTSVTLSALEAVHINPNIIYRINDHWAVAAGIAYYNAYNVDLNNTVLQLNGDGDGWGGNAAIFYHRDAFNFGVSYRSKVKLDIDGTASGLGVVGGPGGATTSVTLPDLIMVGASHRWGEWLLSGEVDWVKWSEFDKIDIVFAAPILNPPTTIPENWDNTVAFRLGIQWDYLPNMRARAGYTYDPTPIVDADFSPRLPGNDRQLFTVGHGMDLLDGKATVDLAYVFALLDDRTQTATPAYNGQYESHTHLFLGAFTYRF